MPLNSPPSTSSRTNSPIPFARGFRFSTQHDERAQKQQTTGSALTRARTESLQSLSPDHSTDSQPIFTDPFTSHSSRSSSFVTYEPPPVPTTVSAPPPAMIPKRARGSILLASGFSFSRQRARSKRKPPPAPPQPFIFSEVIEIGPPARTEEDEERQRLRDAAAQSIGLDPVLLVDRPLASTEEESEDEDRAHTPMPTLPGFPATHAALAPYMLLSARLPKYHPPPSLLMYALARQWKMRVLVLTSVGRTTGLGTGAACLHVFKGIAAEEHELERLEIGPDSVVFVADEDVGGRRGVVKVGGPASTEMTLQILDPSEAHRWITAIKQAVLTQKSIRAGLGFVDHNIDAGSPRGDMDVMLSMRAQGMLSSPTDSSFAPEISSPPLNQVARASGTRSPSMAVSALRGLFTSYGARPRSPSTSSHGDGSGDAEHSQEDSFGRAGTNLLGLLRAGSVTSERPLSPVSPTFALASSGSGSGSGNGSAPSTPRAPELDRKILQDQDEGLAADDAAAAAVPPPGSGFGLLPALIGQDDSHIFRRVGSPSLQPPPRKRAYTASGAPLGPRARPDGATQTYTHTNGSTADSFGIRPGTSAFLSPSPAPASTSAQTVAAQQASPQTSAGSASPESPERRTRTSVSSVSSAFSGELPRSSSDFGSRRWSRQGALPHRLTPPSGPPPAAPSPPSFRASLQRHPYAADASPSRSPSVHSSPQTPPTAPAAASAAFSKRASGSSVHSFSTVSTTHSRGGGGSLLGHHRPLSSHRVSMPPPQRPAPVVALPPTPLEDGPSAAPLATASAPTSPKTSFRESLVLRTQRLSLAPPSTPPTGTLPPRPDEPPAAAAAHRRSSSSSSTPLSPIPASPTPPGPPFPPPSGPLPPPPAPALLSRTTLIRKRLRMLSSPGPAPAAPAPPSPASASAASPYTLPPPPTPIGEPITTMQNDPAFLLAGPPAPPPPPPLPDVPAGPAPEHAGITSLSPPPRRGSRRVVVQEEGAPAPVHARRPSTSDGTETEPRRTSLSVSLSPQPSAVSLVDVRI